MEWQRKKELYAYSVPELVHMVGARFRDYRLRVGMTQKDVSARSGVTVTTIHRLETGVCDNIAFGTLLLLLKAIDMIGNLDKLLPELPVSPYMLREDKVIQRVRHKKQ